MHEAYRIRSLQCLSTALRQSYIIELALLDQPHKGLNHFLDRNLWIYSRAFEEIELFESCEVFVDIVDASAEVFGAGASQSGGPIESRDGNWRTYDESGASPPSTRPPWVSVNPR